MWTRTRGSNFILGMCFGATKGPLCLFFRFARRCLLQGLKVEELLGVKKHVSYAVVEFCVQAVAINTEC